MTSRAWSLLVMYLPSSGAPACAVPPACRHGTEAGWGQESRGKGTGRWARLRSGLHRQGESTPTGWHRRRRRNIMTYYCTYYHSLPYYGKKDNDRSSSYYHQSYYFPQLKGSCCTSSLETSTHGVYIVDCACVCVYAIKRSSPVAVPNDLLNPCHQLLAFEARAAATLEHAVRVRSQTVHLETSGRSWGMRSREEGSHISCDVRGVLSHVFWRRVSGPL